MGEPKLKREPWDVLILGGGLAGLANAIQLARKGFSVALIERKKYPFHRVCGEYISKETLPFLERLGFDPFTHGAQDISRFRLTGPVHSQLEIPLQMGGFGISRHRMDESLAKLAQEAGATIYAGESVTAVDGEEGMVQTARRTLTGRVLIGAFGKRSTIDRELNRAFLKQRSPYVGIKYHLKLDHPNDLIELHNFKDGYLGINRVERDVCCCAYLTTRKNLKKYGSIPEMEAALLHRNPHIKRILTESESLYKAPLVINEITFSRKPLVEDGVLFCGDAAGMIAPLCGNGMAMALHGAAILSPLVTAHLEGKISRQELDRDYRKAWSREFAARLWVGRTIQRFFGNERLTDGVVAGFRQVPPLASWVVRQTHGKPF